MAFFQISDQIKDQIKDCGTLRVKTNELRVKTPVEIENNVINNNFTQTLLTSITKRVSHTFYFTDIAYQSHK